MQEETESLYDLARPIKEMTSVPFRRILHYRASVTPWKLIASKNRKVKKKKRNFQQKPNVIICVAIRYISSRRAGMKVPQTILGEGVTTWTVSLATPECGASERFKRRDLSLFLLAKEMITTASHEFLFFFHYASKMYNGINTFLHFHPFYIQVILILIQSYIGIIEFM